tara:strand:+ start:783 stop:1430 length:648 start_codon:yes stop_codon:yes gene_type:complete
MKLFLDSADTDAIISRYDTGLISGITTNPTLIKKNGGNFLDVYKKLIDVGIHDISMEVVGENESELFERAIILVKEFADKATIKLPCSVDGLRACKRLKMLGVRVNVTLIFSPAQAILASLAGAAYISPFIGRMDDNSLDGMKLINDISNSLDVSTRAINETQILAASIRDPQSVSTAFALGADICTVPIDVFDKMYKHVLTDKGIEQFNKDAGL